MALISPVEVGISCVNMEILSDFYCSIFNFKTISTIQVDEFSIGNISLSNSGYIVRRIQSPFGERLNFLQSDVVFTVDCKENGRGVINYKNAVFITLIVENINLTLDQIEEKGGMKMDSSFEIRAGLKIALAKDCEGNILEIAQYNNINSYRTVSKEN